MEVPPSPKYFWLSFAAMLAFGVVNAVFGYLNYEERIQMRAEQKMTRTMLNARGTIQMILIEAAKQGRPLTKDEAQMVDRLYTPAEYDVITK